MNKLYRDIYQNSVTIRKRDKHIAIISVLLLSTLFQSFSQTSEIKGKLINNQQLEVIYASVMLFQNDSTLVNSTISTPEGDFKFLNVDSGTYSLRIDHMEYEAFTTETFTLSANELKVISTITLQPAMNTLDEVVIIKKKPLIEVKADKLVYNVASSPSASGTNGLDLLKKAPGVTLDMENNISLLGKGGVQIYINGVQSRLSGNDLATFLQSMTSDNIDSIEIISNPSSKYDAEGNAGIINIRMKKNNAFGFNGSETSSFTKGRYYRYSNSLSLNYGGEKLKANLELTQSKNESIDNFLDTKTQNDAVIDLYSRDLRNRKGFNIALGLEARLSEHQTLNFSSRSVINQNDSNLNSQTDIYDTNPTQLSLILLSKSISDQPSKNHTFNLNHQWQLNATTHLNTALSTSFFNNDKNTIQPNTLFEADGSAINSIDNTEFDAKTDINLWSAKTDFEKEWTNTTFSAGIKYSHISTENSFDFYNINGQQAILDITQSNTFNYTENVAAIYAILNFKLSKSLTLNSGIRVENTKSRGRLLSNVEIENKDVPRNYTDIFPNIGLSFDNQKNHTWSLSIGRRITRPNYQDLNPFETPISQLTVWKGNPFLKPNYIMNYQVSYSYKKKLIITNTYSVTKDFFANIFEITGENSNQIIPRNMKRVTNYGISISYPIEVSKHWHFITFLGATHRAFDGKLENTVIDIKATNYNLTIQNNIKLPWDILMDVSYFIENDWIWRGSIRVRGNYDMSFGLRKNFLDKRLQIRITGSDIFKSTNNYFYNGNYGGIDIRGVRTFDSQRFGLGATFKFGNLKAKTKQQTKSALDDELNRIDN